MKRIPRFKEQLEYRRKKRHEIRVGQMAKAVKTAVETVEKKGRGETNPQLMKPKLPPIWSGQEFDRWRIEVEKLFNNNKSTEEEKYIDLLESLKKNDAIKEFVVKTLVEKVREVRIVKRILDVMIESLPRLQEKRH